MDKKIEIVYIKPNDSSFVCGDEQVLKKYYLLTPVLLSQMKGKMKYGLKNISLFFKLLFKGFNKNIVFICWFADYHSAVMVLAAKITGAKSVIFIGLYVS